MREEEEKMGVRKRGRKRTQLKSYNLRNTESAICKILLVEPKIKISMFFQPTL
jgi:hypothetical protein